MTALCTLEGCEKKHYGKGWCLMHYTRWKRHGDPTKRTTPARGEVQRFLAYDGDECLIWPHFRNGSGYAEMNSGDGATSIVSRMVCEEKHGPPPTPKHQAAHSCGDGNLGCVARSHLSWKTPKQNQADRLIHGTHTRGERQGRSKLTQSKVRQIRSRLGSTNQADIAADFGVSAGAISHIARGTTWGWLR